MTVVNYIATVEGVLRDCQDLDLKQPSHIHLIAEKVVDEMAKAVVMDLAEGEK